MLSRIRLLVAILVLTALPVRFGTTVASASSDNPSSCTSTEVKLSVTSNSSLYSSGSLVHITVALHNHSKLACSIATGPVSPDFVLTNSAGVTVWGSCWFGGGPVACPDYLVHRTLAPGATYRDRLTWNQRTGHLDQVVPAGRYTFRVNFLDLRLRASAVFVLTRPQSVTATAAVSGHHYVLDVGDILTVRLGASVYVWTTAVSSNPRVLMSVPEANPVAGLFVFRALAPGSARVSAVGNPACYPQCLMPSQMFYVDVTVVT